MSLYSINNLTVVFFNYSQLITLITYESNIVYNIIWGLYVYLFMYI